MKMRPEALEGGLVEHLLKLGMCHRDDELSPFLKRSSIKVDSAIFRNEPMDVVARGDGTRTQVQGGHDLIDALARGGRHGDDGLAAFGA